MSNIKGTGLLSLPEFIKDKFGPESFQKWLDSLAPEAKALYERSAVASQWYDLNQYFIEPMVLMGDLFYGGSEEGAFEEGRYCAEYSLGGVYRFFLKLGGIKIMIKKAHTILDAYFDSCKLEAEVGEDNRAVMRIVQLDGVHAVVEANIRGWIVKGLEMAGAQGLKVEIGQRLSKGDVCTEYLISWSAEA